MPQERPPFSRKSVSKAVLFTGSFPCGHCSILLSYCTNWFIFIAATRLQSKAASEPDQSLQGGSYREPSVLLAQLSRHGKQNRLEARPSLCKDAGVFFPIPSHLNLDILVFMLHKSSFTPNLWGYHQEVGWVRVHCGWTELQSKVSRVKTRQFERFIRIVIPLLPIINLLF